MRYRTLAVVFGFVTTLTWTRRGRRRRRPTSRSNKRSSPVRLRHIGAAVRVRTTRIVEDVATERAVRTAVLVARCRSAMNERHTEHGGRLSQAHWRVTLRDETTDVCVVVSDRP